MLQQQQQRRKKQTKKTGLQVHLLFVAAVLVSPFPPALWSAEPELKGQKKYNRSKKKNDPSLLICSNSPPKKQRKEAS